MCELVVVILDENLITRKQYLVLQCLRESNVWFSYGFLYRKHFFGKFTDVQNLLYCGLALESKINISQREGTKSRGGDQITELKMGIWVGLVIRNHIPILVFRIVRFIEIRNPYSNSLLHVVHDSADPLF